MAKIEFEFGRVKAAVARRDMAPRLMAVQQHQRHIMTIRDRHHQQLMRISGRAIVHPPIIALRIVIHQHQGIMRHHRHHVLVTWHHRHSDIHQVAEEYHIRAQTIVVGFQHVDVARVFVLVHHALS